MNNKYCVYLHKTQLGFVFYVGSGTLTRAFRKELSQQKGDASKRGKDYSNFVKSLDYDYDVEILQQNLTKAESIDAERELYLKYKHQLVNKSLPSAVNKIDVEQLSEFVIYDEASPSGLRWLKSPSLKIKQGSFCLNQDRLGRWQVRLNGVRLFSHRIVMALHGFDVDENLVDHVDGNVSNNKINNLRLVTPKVNSQNRRLPSNNTSGTQGVSYCKTESRWVASWYDDSGKYRHKGFSCRKFGDDLAKKMATEYRLEQVKLLNKNGADYSTRHLEVRI